MIESGLAPVIVAAGTRLREAMCRSRIAAHVRPARLRAGCKPFIVQVPPKARDLLLTNGHARFAADGAAGTVRRACDGEPLPETRSGSRWENRSGTTIGA